MKSNLKKPNKLLKYLEQKNTYNKDFTAIDANTLSDFPILDVKIIEQYITFGSYQISQSFGYLAEHFKANGRYIIKINNELVEERFKI